MTNQVSRLLWLRHETKPFEKRTALTPIDARALIEDGHRVVVESSPVRIFHDDEYREVGCEIAPAESWREAPKNAFILGLKEITECPDSLGHRHIYFAHCFKGQEGSRELLQTFARGGGTLYDLEFLTYSTGKRVAAFGVWAGFAGAGLGLQTWALTQKGEDPNQSAPLEPFKSSAEFIEKVGKELSTLPAKPRVLLIGARGRCGRGAKRFLHALGIEPVEWNSKDTRGRSPIPEILDFDLMINCALSMSEAKPFLTRELIHQRTDRNLTTISDVSCDPDSQCNPLPVYRTCTTFDSPVIRVENIKAPELFLTAIDHLPSLLPRESSEDFSAQLITHLRELLNEKWENSPWERSLEVYYEQLHAYGLLAEASNPLK